MASVSVICTNPKDTSKTIRAYLREDTATYSDICSILEAEATFVDKWSPEKGALASGGVTALLLAPAGPIIAGVAGLVGGTIGAWAWYGKTKVMEDRYYIQGISYRGLQLGQMGNEELLRTVRTMGAKQDAYLDVVWGRCITTTRWE